MSSLDAVRAQVPCDVTYNTIYMHQINRKYHFHVFFLSLQLTKSSQQTTWPESSPSRPSTGVAVAFINVVRFPMRYTAYNAFLKLLWPLHHLHDVQLPTARPTENFDCCFCSNVK